MVVLKTYCCWMHYPDGETQAGPHFQLRDQSGHSNAIALYSSSSEAGPSHHAGCSCIAIVKLPNNYQLVEAPIQEVLSIVGSTSLKGWHCVETLYTWANLKVTVPVLPVMLQKDALQQCHDSPPAGHQGAQKDPLPTET